MRFWIFAILSVIALASADNECAEDEQHYKNKPACTNTCENYPIRDRIRCMSSPAGCFCREGLVKRKDGKCVPLEMCNQGCGENEEIVACSKPKWCNTCGIRGNCKLTGCSQGCDCKEGYYRNQNEVCIPKSLCPVDGCGENEEIVSCSKPKWCNTCGIRGNCKLTGCSQGCDCKEGYYRNQNEVCIPKSLCPVDGPIKCGANETYVQCVPCANTCETYEQRFYCKPACRPGCTCNERLVKRNDGKCVPPAECFPPSEK